MFGPLARFVSTRLGAGIVVALIMAWVAATGYGYVRMVDADAPLWVQATFGLMAFVAVIEMMVITFTLGLGRFVVTGHRPTAY